MWYLISGNAERIPREVRFDELVLSTDEFDVRITRDDEIYQWTFSEADKVQQGGFRADDNPAHGSAVDILNRLIVGRQSSSLYFPTFRRIEGGYSTTGLHKVRSEANRQEGVQRELQGLAERISVLDHRFICSISTNDLVSLLTQRYASVSEALNAEYKNFSTSIIDTIRVAKSKGQQSVERDGPAILNEIQSRADTINALQEQLLRPFALLADLTGKLFRHTGISIQAVTLGQSADAIDSGLLSAGEKQMLSFLCYNAFSQDSVIFIDEPELSLHPDWQRRLFGILLKQQPTNQFIVATHSPFIYTKYEDKEIAIQEEKGE